MSGGRGAYVRPLDFRDGLPTASVIDELQDRHRSGAAGRGRRAAAPPENDDAGARERGRPGNDGSTRRKS